MEPDYSTLTVTLDLVNLIQALVSVFGALAAVYTAKRGLEMILEFVREHHQYRDAWQRSGEYRAAWERERESVKEWIAENAESEADYWEMLRNWDWSDDDRDD